MSAQFFNFFKGVKLVLASAGLFLAFSSSANALAQTSSNVIVMGTKPTQEQNSIPNAPTSVPNLMPKNGIFVESTFIEVPERIPISCVQASAKRYSVPEMALLAILKQESGGRTNVVGHNKNGSKDYGPAQFNDRSWGRYMNEKYGITLEELNSNMCQAIMAQGYALRSEWDRCRKKGDQSIWCAIALYHSPTKKFQDRYVKGVWGHYQKMIKTGKF